jgi:GH15 family glucan-1,4-alpha-glucosidase
VRNWDYRYCWLRDATFTLLAFMQLGYYDEARAWRDWLIRDVAGSPKQVQIMYGVGGERWLPELIVPWLHGYENSSPVRIGNAAHKQLQLDVFGEIADAMFQTLKSRMQPSERGLALRPVVLDYLSAVWRQPDEGIWRCAASRSTSCIRRSWRGSHLIALRVRSKLRPLTKRGNGGAQLPMRFTPKSASAASTAT